MCAHKKNEQHRKNNDRRRNNDKSIESIDYDDGVVFVSISVCRLLHFGHVAHIAIALFLYWNGQTSKEYSLRTKWRTVLIIWLGWFYTFFLSLSLSSVHVLCSFHKNSSIDLYVPMMLMVLCSWWPSCGHYNEKLNSDKLQSMISACNHPFIRYCYWTGRTVCSTLRY